MSRRRWIILFSVVGMGLLIGKEYDFNTYETLIYTFSGLGLAGYYND
jgi:hypothetical protein